ncbi:hypothetical protein ACIGO6_38775 [Streptomyces sp. NPDC053750]|uniref:hypothetical protein n=1 Tax=Streptomyces sp. NPDC053750 TaxID=3365714 RepID=UPI0037D1A256
MGNNSGAAGTRMCKWCNRPLRKRQWRRYCNRRHAMKYRVVDFFDNLLSGMF